MLVWLVVALIIGGVSGAVLAGTVRQWRRLWHRETVLTLTTGRTITGIVVSRGPRLVTMREASTFTDRGERVPLDHTVTVERRLIEFGQVSR